MKSTFSICIIGIGILLSGCTPVGTLRDGTKPVLYSAREVQSWPVVNEARQFNNDIRIYIHPTAKVDRDAQLGVGTRIGARTKIDGDTSVYPNVTIGEDVVIGEDAVIHEDVQIGDHAKIGGNARVGAGAVVKPYGYVRTHSTIKAQSIVEASEQPKSGTHATR